MIDAGEVRKGITLELDGNLYRVIEYQHIKIGRGSAQVRLRLRGILVGHTIERTFPASERFTQAHLEHHTMRYLYRDGDLYYFMDTDNFEQFPLSTEQLADTLGYIKEGSTVEVLMYKDKPIGVEIPNAVELEIVETGPSFKGDTASAGGKPATMETGIVVQVPFFISVGDRIKVDTRSGEYLERVN